MCVIDKLNHYFGHGRKLLVALQDNIIISYIMASMIDT